MSIVLTFVLAVACLERLYRIRTVGSTPSARASIVVLATLTAASATNIATVSTFLDELLNWPHVSTPITQATLVAVACSGPLLTRSILEQPSKRTVVILLFTGPLVTVAEFVLFLGAGTVAPDENSGYAFTKDYGADAWIAESNLIVLVFVAICGLVTVWNTRSVRATSPEGLGLRIFAVGVGLLVIVAFIRMGGLIHARYLDGSLGGALDAGSSLAAGALLLVATGTLWAPIFRWYRARRVLHVLDPLRNTLRRQYPSFAPLAAATSGLTAPQRVVAVSAGIVDGIQMAVKVSGAPMPSTRPQHVAAWLKDSDRKIDLDGKILVPDEQDLDPRQLRWVLAVASHFRRMTSTRRAKSMDLAASVLSEVAAPWVWNIVVPIVVGTSVGSVSWGIFAGAVMGLLPMIVIVGLMAFRKVVDHHVSNKTERPIVVVAIGLIVIAGFTAMVINSAPNELTSLVAAGFVVVVVAGTITAATSHKVSFHASVAWGQTLALAIIIQSAWTVVAIAIASGTCWARIQLRAHTKVEIAIGTGVGLAGVAIVFALVKAFGLA